MIDIFLIGVLVVAALTVISPVVLIVNDNRVSPSSVVELIARITLFAGSTICIGVAVALSLVMLGVF